MANQVAYGFHNLADVFGERATVVGEDRINNAVSLAVDEHNRQMSAMMNLFVNEVDPVKFQTTFDAAIVTRNQPLDESGRPDPIKGAAQYSVAFPLQMSGNAIGWDFVAFQKLSVEEINNKVYAVLMGDQRWMFDHILSALYTNVDTTFWSKQTSTITVKPLANGDTVTYHITPGVDQAATDNHYLAQAAGIANATNPYALIRPELEEHEENGGIGSIVIAFVPTNLMATTAALSTYHPVADPNVMPGANTAVLQGNLPVAVPGRLRGYEDSGVWIVEYPRLPNDYIVAVAYGGEKPLGMRQDAEASLQGFVEVPAESDRTQFPYLRRTWIRRAGFGAWNRTGAVVYRIGNASYAIPTGWTALLP
jgi:hypothetical protein